MSSTLESLPSPSVVRPVPARDTRRAGLGFAATILTSAFLLFEVQPLLSKFILPWFGGSPAVWTTAMLFFQVMLFAGYAYAHLLTRLFTPRWQAIVHSGLLVTAACLLPIAPDAAWKPTDAGEPTGGSWRCWSCASACPIWCWPRPVRWSKPGMPRLSEIVALSAVRAVECRFVGGTAQLSVLFRAGTRHFEPGLVVVGWLSGLRRALCRAAVGGKPGDRPPVVVMPSRWLRSDRLPPGAGGWRGWRCRLAVRSRCWRRRTMFARTWR